MCRVEGCDGKVTSHGLCQKHYMRQRRQGDPLKTGKPGPKPSGFNQVFASLYRDYSPRTIACIKRIQKLEKWLAQQEGIEHKLLMLRLNAQVARPNGTHSVSRKLALLEDLCAMKMVELGLTHAD